MSAVLSPVELREALRAEAACKGFAETRIARAGAPEHAAEFRQWLADGCHAEMAWMERNADRRCDPDLVLPGVRSVIVLAMNYFDGDESSAAPWRVVRYARGEDYHLMMEKRLRELDEWLRGHGGSQRCYVDTGPVLERDWAASSGLGWSGKSTVQIHPELGTWFFLATIFTTLELPADEPYPKRCGSCTRCLDSCPTGAITPHRLDARKCLSYWSIEHRGSIPEEYRRAMGDRLYGCEDCLAVCPWNRFAKASSEAVFQSRFRDVTFPAREFLTFSEENFREFFRKSPVKRLKRSGFLRNVCIVIGNTGDEQDLPALRAAMAEEDALVAEHAAWAVAEILGRLGREEEKRAVEKFFE